MNNPIDFFRSLFKNKKTTLTGREAIALQYLHPEKGAINTGDYCTTQDIANLAASPAPPEYPKIYKAILAQSGTNDPVAIVLNSNDANYLGDLAWNRADAGLYNALYIGVTNINTFVSWSGYVGGDPTGTMYCEAYSDGIYLICSADGGFADGNNIYITIEYYGA